jgi:hypothetical protein
MVLDSLGRYDHSWGLVTLGCGFPTMVCRPRPCALTYGTPKLVLPTLSHKGSLAPYRFPYAWA